jgi:hypothetical protein
MEVATYTLLGSCIEMLTNDLKSRCELVRNCAGLSNSEELVLSCSCASSPLVAVNSTGAQMRRGVGPYPALSRRREYRDCGRLAAGM